MTDSTIDLAGRAWDAFRIRKQRNVENMLDDTAESLGLNVRDLLIAALKDDASADLLYHALAAAADTISEQKVRALAMSLANGLRHDAAEVEQEALIVRAIADLDPAHVKLLAVIAKHRRQTEPWLQQQAGLNNETFGPVVTVLERNNLVIDDTDLPRRYEHAKQEDANSSLLSVTSAWKVTGFGLAAMRRLDPTTS